jgi:tight adherence protein C
VTGTLPTWLSTLPWQLVVGAAAALVAVVAGLLGLRHLFAPPSEVVQRLERSSGPLAPAARVTETNTRPLPIFLRPLAWIVRPTRAEELSRLRQKLIHAGLRAPRAMEVFLVAKVLSAAVLTVLFYQLNGKIPRLHLTFPFDLAVAVWLCVGGFYLPHFWLHSKVKQRQLRISNGMPDAMDLMVTCVESGLSLDAAISRVSEDIGLASPVLGDELNLTFLEIQAGIRRADAFRRLAERTGVDDLRSLSAMLIQTEMFGTSVARALRVHSDGMRVRRMQSAEERAATVGVKMTIPLIMCILPALMAIVVGPAIISIAKNFIGSP